MSFKFPEWMDEYGKIVPEWAKPWPRPWWRRLIQQGWEPYPDKPFVWIDVWRGSLRWDVEGDRRSRPELWEKRDAQFNDLFEHIKDFRLLNS